MDIDILMRATKVPLSQNDGLSVLGTVLR